MREAGFPTPVSPLPLALLSFRPVPDRTIVNGQSRIGEGDRDAIAGRITAGWAQGHSVDHTFASTWDAGVMLASRRSWWRVAADIQDQTARPVTPTKRGSKTPREAPVLEATGPGQVWSWDITDLRTPWRGCSFKAYSIIDIYSRKLVGWRVGDREVDYLAVEMFHNTIAREGAPDVVQADSGPAMRSTVLKDYLREREVTQTHNRPQVSNDNPFSESEFRTMKYRPNYPGTFETLDDARAFMSWYVPWYNQNHKHSGIALFSPNEVHDGTWRQLWARRVTDTARVLRTPSRTIPRSSNHPGTRRVRRHQPTHDPSSRTPRRTTPRSLTSRATGSSTGRQWAVPWPPMGSLTWPPTDYGLLAASEVQSGGQLLGSP